MQGNLYATAAYTAANQSDRYTAYALVAEAEANTDRLGQLLGTGRQRFLRPQPIASAPDLDQPPPRQRGRRLDYAQHIDANTLPTAEPTGGRRRHGFLPSPVIDPRGVWCPCLGTSWGPHGVRHSEWQSLPCTTCT